MTKKIDPIKNRIQIKKMSYSKCFKFKVNQEKKKKNKREKNYPNNLVKEKEKDRGPGATGYI